MPNNIQNNGPSWQSRLDQLEGLPGENFNASQAWEKLQQRTGSTQRRDKKPWYWAAACILLAIAGLLFSNLLYKENLLEGDMTGHLEFEFSSAVFTSKFVDDFARSKTAQVKKVAALNPVQNKIASRHDGSMLTRKMVIPTGIGQAPKAPVFIDTLRILPAAFNTNSIVLQTNKKKSLRVVHLNELAAKEGDVIFPGQTGDEFRRFVRPPGKDYSIDIPAPVQRTGEHILFRNLNSQN